MLKGLTLTLGIITLLAPVSQAQGQEKFRVTGQAARRIVAQAITVPDDNLPMIKGAAIIVASGPNNVASRTVTFAIKHPTGQYIARGFSTIDSAPVTLAVWDFSSGNDVSSIWQTIINGDPSQVLPGIGQFWKADLIHLNGGSVEKLSATTQPYGDTLSGLQFSIGGETLDNGTYFLSVGGKFSADASVALGGTTVTDVSFSPFGGITASLPISLIGSLSGMVTATVCTSTNTDGTNGWCGTDVYHAKLVNTGSSGGKG